MSKKKEVKSGDYRTLQSFSDYVDLYSDLINGLLNAGPLAGQIDSKMAQAIGLLSGYAGTALKNAHGGKTQLTVFLRDMHKVNVAALTDDQMSQFLQGDEFTQVQILKEIKDVEGMNAVEAEIIPIKEAPVKMDKETVATMAGVSEEKVDAALKGEVTDKPKYARHDWRKTLEGTGVYCKNCLKEKDSWEADDLISVCSNKPNLY
jgi:hypothetical protein